MKLVKISDAAAMRSLKSLCEQYEKDPHGSFHNVHKIMNGEKVYTNDAAVYFLMGLLQGATACMINNDYKLTLSGIIKGHEIFMGLKTADYIGEERKYGRKQ